MSTGACDVLLVAAEWQSRALLLAELQEDGYDVRAAPSLRHGFQALLAGRVRPRLVLLDVHGDPEATPAYVAQIPDLTPAATLLVLVGVYDRGPWDGLRDCGAEILQRPLAVAEVVEVVGRLLGAGRGGQHEQ